MGAASAIIWDFDGTLAHRPGMWSQCLAEIAGEFLGEQLPREQFVPFLSKGFPWHAPENSHTSIVGADAWWESLEPVFAAAFSGAMRISAADVVPLTKKVRGRYIDPSGWTIFGDTVPALDCLSRSGWEHIILSNHVPELPRIVAGLGLAHHFKAVLTSAEIGYEKPRKECFAAAISCVPGSLRTVVVGDSASADIAGAIAAGLEAVLVRSTPLNREVHCVGLNALAEHLNEI